MHVFMSYCTFPALKILLQNYLGFGDSDMELKSPVMEEIESVIDKAQMTPADISEVLIKNRRHKEKAMNELLEALRTETRKKEKNSTEVEDEEQEKRALENPKQNCDDGEEFEEKSWKKESSAEDDEDREKLN